MSTAVASARRVAKRPPPWLRLVLTVLPLLGFLLAGWAWAWASPIGSAPDDDWHMSSIWCPMPLESSGCLTGGTTENGLPLVEVPAEFAAITCYFNQPNKSAACANGFLNAGTVETHRVDTGSYPGWYYKFAHFLVGPDVQQTVYSIRVLNVALAGLVVFAAALITPRQARTPVVVGSLVAVVPLGIFLAASVSPNSWGNTGVLGAWAATHALLTADDRRRRILATGLLLICAVMAAGARGDSAAFVVVVTVAFAVLQWRRKIPWSSWAAIAAAGVIGVVGFLQARQVGVLSDGWSTHSEPLDPKHLFFENLMELPSLFAGVFGVGWGLGWLEVQLPAATSVLMTLAVGGLVFGGLRQISLRKLLTTALFVGAAGGVAMLILQQSQARTGAEVQPRYLLPMILVLLSYLLVDARRPGRSVNLPMASRWLLWSFLVLAHSAALHRTIRRYVSGIEVVGFNLDRVVEWWVNPLVSPAGLWTLGSVGFAIAAAAILVVGRPAPGALAGAPGSLAEVRAVGEPRSLGVDPSRPAAQAPPGSDGAGALGDEKPTP